MAKTRSWEAVVSWAAVAVLAAAVVALTMRASHRIGRLQFFPRVDDVIYMARGAEWLRLFREGGMGAVLRDYVANPPHSPWGAGTAMAGFAVLGVEPWAAYATTFVQVAVALAVANILLRRVRLLERVMCLGIVACAPLLAAGVHNFKPDYFAAILTAAGIMLALRRPLMNRRPRVDLLTGALFGAALVVKPSIFAMTGVLVCASIGTAALMNTLSRRRLDVGAVARRVAWTSLGTLLVAGVHFAVAAPKLWKYMYDNMLGERSDLWAPERTPGEHALFFLTGPGGQVMLGPMLWIAGGLIVLAAVTVAARRRRTEMLNAGALGLMLLVTYLLPTLNWMKILTFGLTFQTLLVVAAVASAAYLVGVQRAARPRMPWGTLVIAGALCASVATLAWRFPQPRIHEHEGRGPSLTERGAIVDEVYAIVRGELNQPAMTVGVSGPHGDLNVNLLTLWLVRDGSDARAHRIDDVRGLTEQRRLAGFDVVIVHDGRTPMTVARRTSPDSLERLRQAVQEDAFERVGRVDVPRTQGAVEVYRRR